MIDLREHARLNRPESKTLDDSRLELQSHVYRYVRPSETLPQRRVLQAEIREMRLPGQTSGFGYDYYDAVRGVGPLSPRAVRFGRQDTSDLRQESHALKTVLLKPGETFVKFIHEGGSGAQPYVVKRPDGHEVLRKLMLEGSFKKQDEEAKGEEVMRGYGQAARALENLDNHPKKQDPRVTAVLKNPEKAALLQKFIRETRPKYFSRYMATVHEPGKGRMFASFFDQEFVQGSEFAQSISNKNVALKSEELETLVNAQVSILETFYAYQSKIYQQPVNSSESSAEAGGYYLSRLESRVFGPLRARKFENVLLSLPGERAGFWASPVRLFQPKSARRFSLAELLQQEYVTINGRSFPNPLPQLPELIRATPSPLLGWSMHGDPQQTNFLLKPPLGAEHSQHQRGVSVDAPADNPKLLCIDNRPAQITPYTADLEKVIWGASWVSLFQGYEQVRRDESSTRKGLSFRLGHRSGAERSVENFRQFDLHLKNVLSEAPWFKKLLSRDSRLQQRVALASVTQCLCDIGIAVQRLNDARRAIVDADNDVDLIATQNLIQMLTERIVGDFLRACQNFADYQLLVHSSA